MSLHKSLADKVFAFYLLSFLQVAAEPLEWRKVLSMTVRLQRLPSTLCSLSPHLLDYTGIEGE